MNDVHIFTTSCQPATHHFDYTFDPPMEFYIDGGAIIHAECCGKAREAKNLVVQCFYDGRSFWCAAGMGCKNPAILKAKADREFSNRSEGQKRRWKAKKGET